MKLPISRIWTSISIKLPISSFTVQIENRSARFLAPAQVFRHVTRSHVFDRPLELRFQQVVQQVDEIVAAGGFIRVKGLLEGQIDKQIGERTILARFYNTVLQGLTFLHLLLHPPQTCVKRQGFRLHKLFPLKYYPNDATVQADLAEMGSAK